MHDFQNKPVIEFDFEVNQYSAKDIDKLIKLLNHVKKIVEKSPSYEQCTEYLMQNGFKDITKDVKNYIDKK